MIRPGTNVNSPAITSAAEEYADHGLAMRAKRRAAAPPITATGSMIRVKIDSRWIGLNGPTIRIS